MSTAGFLNDLDLKYSFLRVRKEKESIILGISPTSKTQQEIIKVTKNLSTVQNAGKGGLLSFKKSILDQLQLDEKTLSQTLVPLVNNQFLCQVPVFEYEPSEFLITIVPYFITHPGDDKNFSIANLFEELIVSSFKNLKYWYEGKPKVSPDEQESEYDWYLKGNKTPFRGNTNIFNCFQMLKEFNNGIPIYEEVIEYISKDIERRFIESNLSVPLNNFGILFVKKGEVHEMFETANHFMTEKIIEPLLEDSAVRAELDPLLLEKKIYYETNDFPIKTTKYAVALANALKLIKKRDGNDNPSQLLTVDIILQLESSVEDYYMNQWREDCDNVKKEFKRSITAPSSRWTNLITFIQHADSLRYPPDVWKDLLVDKEMYYIKWQSPKSTVHVFTGKEHSFIRSLVVGMIAVSPAEHWKAVALKYLVDKYERTLRPLLIDANFSVIYQELSKKVYMPYIPWYFRILMFIPIQSLIDVFFEKAREKIKHEQDMLALRNEVMIKKIDNELDSKRKTLMDKVKDGYYSDGFKKVLDKFYFSKKSVPTLKEFKESFPDDPNLAETLKKRKFRIVTVPVRGGEPQEVVLYPSDESWNSKKALLIEYLENVVADRNPHLTTSVDMARIEKAQNLLDILVQEV